MPEHTGPAGGGYSYRLAWKSRAESIYRLYCTVLPWDQPHCGGEVSAASVLLPVAELRGEKTSGDGANTRNRQQALPEGVVGKLPLELLFNIADLLGEIFKVRMFG